MAISGLHLTASIYYGLIFFPALFNLLTHGKHGILAWWFVLTFCIVRLIGNIMRLVIEARGENPHSEGVLIVESIGLSPLFLGILGVVHEGRMARNQLYTQGRKVAEWAFVIAFHTIITVSVVLIIIGVIQDIDDNKRPQDSGLLRAGIVITWLLWAVLSVYALATFRNGGRHERVRGTMRFRYGRILVLASIVSLPLLVLRLLHGTLAFNLNSSTFANSIGWEAGLQIVPEMLLALVLTIAGLYTRRIWKTPMLVGDQLVEPKSPAAERLSKPQKAWYGNN